ncbi:PQQ-like beta-propeller repeat protein [Gordonia sp. HY285]|uniref:outer membrane protein assembly factor BamB family protein n=1 Tax=Gordonia liuliyuniae TaxID=2911517 RepID=UPI001F324A2C|nr:PQQ-binding-like beta-propeller repeat protein [Gordonia liuliyuniae]MCF8609589.1 PQQ-like beta-propeller repeat protein [Gordonia liuliyuniae]
MPIQTRSRRLPLGMGAVAALGSAALVITAGLVLGQSAEDEIAGGHGVLHGYTSAPETAWTLDEQSLPGLTGDGDIEVADTSGDDWLVSYTAGIRRVYVLVDADTGASRWDAPVNAGFGACAFDESGDIGCAVRTRTDGPDNGFFLVDRESGHLEPASRGSDTADLVGIGADYIHVNDSGYGVSRRSPSGDERWSRTFASSATPTVSDGVLVVTTSDGARFVLDPETGEDVVACQDCEVTTYPTGLVVSRSHDGTTTLDFYRVSDGVVDPDRTRSADGLQVVPGPSTLPVVTAAGDTVLESHGRYQILDPGTGRAVWEVADAELSKVHTRPCGPQVSFARKDRSRVFFTLADGARVGELPEPALGHPEVDIDMLSCVGASDEVAVFGNGSQLTAFRPSTGDQAWTFPINGDASVVDGRIVLVQGSTLSVLR